MRLRIAAGLVAALALFARPAKAEGPTTALLPVWGATSPPQGSTFLRLTRELADVAHAKLGAVRVLTRERRQEVCADRGHQCPHEVATLLEMDRVIELDVSEALDKLQVRIWGRPARLLNEATVPCAWEDGRARCDLEAFERAVAPSKGAEAFDEAAVDRAFRALGKRLEGCKQKKSSNKRSATDKEVSVSVSFRVGNDGRAREVRIDPRELQAAPAWRCVARLVESLRVPPFAGAEPSAFRYEVGRARLGDADAAPPP